MSAFSPLFGELSQIRSERECATPLLWNGRQIGSLLADTVALCERERSVFRRHADGVHLLPIHTGEVARHLEPTLGKWHDSRLIPLWSDERMDARDPETGIVLFPIERAARVVLGLAMAGVHLNVWTVRHGAPHLWIARRASHKKVEPLKWDNCADGGIGASESATIAMVREAHEEAGLAPERTYGATACGCYRIHHAFGGHPFIEFAYPFELQVDDGIELHNRDGEVERFECVDVPPLANRLARGEFTRDAAITSLAWIERHGRHTLDDATARRLQILRAPCESVAP
jgi:8-oxo-dGTP pyrophosphatase MutT (NUDIX family)